MSSMYSIDEDDINDYYGIDKAMLDRDCAKGC